MDNTWTKITVRNHVYITCLFYDYSLHKLMPAYITITSQGISIRSQVSYGF